MVHQSSGHFTRSLAFTEPWDGLCHGFVVPRFFISRIIFWIVGTCPMSKKNLSELFPRGHHFQDCCGVTFDFASGIIISPVVCSNRTPVWPLSSSWTSSLATCARELGSHGRSRNHGECWGDSCLNAPMIKAIYI